MSCSWHLQHCAQRPGSIPHVKSFDRNLDDRVVHPAPASSGGRYLWHGHLGVRIHHYIICGHPHQLCTPAGQESFTDHLLESAWVCGCSLLSFSPSLQLLDRRFYFIININSEASLIVVICAGSGAACVIIKLQIKLLK